jgi:hypothetical protein
MKNSMPATGGGEERAGQSDRRPLESMQNLPRASSASHFRTAIEKAGLSYAGKFPKLRNFGPAAYLEYIREYASHIFLRRVPFPDAGSAPGRSIYRDDHAEVRFGIAGDWGTGTDEAFVAARGLAQPVPDYTIHLGDVYFIGDKAEIDTNFLGRPSHRYRTGYQTVRWPLGSRGTFALNGNHEMYANGNGYFNHLLPALGLAVGRGKQAGQGCSFFAIEMDRWIVVAVDTGYNSRGLPFVSQLDPSGIGWVRRLQDRMKPSCCLPDALVSWLRDDVRPRIGTGAAAKGVVLMSHHQYFSAFPEEFAFELPAQQIQAALGIASAIWFWGHEHRFAGYDFGGPGGLQVHGRCLGHGGMPVSTAKAVPERPPPGSAPTGARAPALRFFDNRAYQTNEDGSVFGWNGYMKLKVTGDVVTARYYDIASIQAPGGCDEFAEVDYRDRLLLEERFTLQTDGAIRCETTQYCVEEGFFGPAKWG